MRMLQAVSRLGFRLDSVEILTARKEAFKFFGSGLHTTSAAQKVLQKEEAPLPRAPLPPPERGHAGAAGGGVGAAGGGAGGGAGGRARLAAAAAAAVTASIAGVYLYRKQNEKLPDKVEESTAAAASVPAEPAPIPASGAEFPARVPYLIVGGGTAAFAALRAIRAHQPAAAVLVVAREHALPYMRPPLSKEVWAEGLDAATLADPDRLAFKQWDGRRRRLSYEPEAFYAPLSALGGPLGGVAVARGWEATALDADAATATLRPVDGGESVTIEFEKCLLATGAEARRLPALAAARAAGRALSLRTARDAARLAARLAAAEGAEGAAAGAAAGAEGAGCARRPLRVAVVGGGLLGTELANQLCSRESLAVSLLCRSAVLARVLPRYLARDLERRLQEKGLRLLPNVEVVSSEVVGEEVTLHLSNGESRQYDLVVECVGAVANDALAAGGGLQRAAGGGVRVNAELQARGRVWAAGDAAAAGARGGHDGAVHAGRTAGENMARGPAAAAALVRPTMMWSDLPPSVAYEAVGEIDPELQTVGIFAADAVSAYEETHAAAGAGAGAGAGAEAAAQAVAGAEPAPAEAERRRYERGVVLYVRERRVVGVLLWNLFNRLQLARQVLSVGHFDDLLEVGKLFNVQEEEEAD